jgi:hypothetical protein
MNLRPFQKMWDLFIINLINKISQLRRRMVMKFKSPCNNFHLQKHNKHSRLKINGIFLNYQFNVQALINFVTKQMNVD